MDFRITESIDILRIKSDTRGISPDIFSESLGGEDNLTNLVARCVYLKGVLSSMLYFGFDLSGIDLQGVIIQLALHHH